MTQPIRDQGTSLPRVSLRRPWVRPMAARDPHESHRSATPLELLFDLCFVAAVAQASTGLHHGLAEGHIAESVGSYALVFFGIWWGWVNFTWFASAYDSDDVAYRLLVLVQIAGALVIAAGVPQAFEEQDYRAMVLGYTILRVGLVANWIRAGRSDPSRCRTCMRFALGLTLCQIGWISLLSTPERFFLTGWLLLAAAELAVPIWAERAGKTSWHPHHVTERYGLFTLIVLGESVMAATLAVQSTLAIATFSGPLFSLTCGGLLVIFGMWWLYFEQSTDWLCSSGREAFVWGYGHLVIFAAAAAVGAGLALCVDQVMGKSDHVSDRMAVVIVAISVALYILAVWAIEVRPAWQERWLTYAYWIIALLVVAVSFLDGSVLLIGVLLAVLVVATTIETEGSHGHLVARCEEDGMVR